MKVIVNGRFEADRESRSGLSSRGCITNETTYSPMGISDTGRHGRCAGHVRGKAAGSRRQPDLHVPDPKDGLENGLSVMSVPFDTPGIIAYYTVVRTGSRNEVEKGLSGFAHFFEHMMFRGTEAYPQEKYNDVLKLLGADSNAYTNDDWTCYHMTIPAPGPGNSGGDRRLSRSVSEP